MIDVDPMQNYIREANPVPDPDQLVPDELVRFVAMAEAPSRAADTIDGAPFGRHSDRRRGPLVAVATAAVALGLVAFAVVVTRPFEGTSVTDEIRPPTATSQPDVTSAFRNPALYTKRLVPIRAPNPSPLSTAIGNLEFEMLEFESSAYSLYEVAWTPHGLVAVENDRLYWSTDYYTWHSIDSPVPVDIVTPVDEDIVVHGIAGTLRFVWDGAGWIESAALDVMDADRIAFGSDGAVAVVGDGLWYSADGVHFEESEKAPAPISVEASDRASCPSQFGPLDSGPPVLATEAGFLTLTSSWTGWLGEHPICAPVLWFSVDGSEWELVSEESPFGETATVYEVGEREGQFVAVGAVIGTPAVVWVSDNGFAWERIDFELENIDGIAGGGLGWIVTGSNLGTGDEEWVQSMMLSADGRTWDGPYLRPETLNTGYLPPQIAVGDDVIFSIGGSGNDALLARLQD